MVSSRIVCIEIVCTVITVWIAETYPLIRCIYACTNVMQLVEEILRSTRSEVIVKCTG